MRPVRGNKFFIFDTEKILWEEKQNIDTSTHVSWDRTHKNSIVQKLNNSQSSDINLHHYYHKVLTQPKLTFIIIFKCRSLVPCNRDAWKKWTKESLSLESVTRVFLYPLKFKAGWGWGCKMECFVLFFIKIIYLVSLIFMIKLWSESSWFDFIAKKSGFYSNSNQ